jgi:hypothetical protein
MLADPEAQLLAALKASKPIVSGCRYSEERAIYAGADFASPSEIGVLKKKQTNGGGRRRTTAKVTSEEYKLMEDMFYEIGDIPRVCDIIADRLIAHGSYRSGQCVGDQLNKTGIRPYRRKVTP